MKKLLAILVLGLLWCSVGFAEEHGKTLEELFKGEKKKEFKFKDEEWKPATVNSYTKGGYKIVDVQHQSGVLFYTLQKSKKVIVCKVFALGEPLTRCFEP